jgi:conjugative transfer region protein TrbK
MDGKTLARIGAIIFVAFACLTAVIDMNRPDDGQADFAMPRPAVIGAIRSMRNSHGAAGWAKRGRDPSCLKAWAENRRRFLGQPAAFAPAAPRALPGPAVNGGR